MPAGSTREQAREDLRARILQAARSLLADRGPDDVTMAEIGRASGVARATVFNHFGCKRALVEAITEEVLARYGELLENALADRATSTPALIRALFELMGAGIEDDRRFYRAMFREIARLSLGLDEGGPGQLARQAALDRLVQLLTRGQARGELTTEHQPEDLAVAFDSLVFGTITHWLYDDVTEELRVRMQRAAEVFLGRVALTGPDDVEPASVRGLRRRGRKAPTPRRRPRRR